MTEEVSKLKSDFRERQRAVSVEDRIRQLYAMQERYLAISRAAISGGLKRDDREYRKACRLLGRDEEL